MNEELVQVRKRTDPADAEEPRRRARPDPGHEPPEVAAFRESYPPPLGEALERTREHNAGASDQIALAQDDVCGEVVSSPSLEQSGHGRPQLVEHVAQLPSLLRIEGEIAHPPKSTDVVDESFPGWRDVVPEARDVAPAAEDRARQAQAGPEPDWGPVGGHGPMRTGAWSGARKVSDRNLNQPTTWRRPNHPPAAGTPPAGRAGRPVRVGGSGGGRYRVPQRVPAGSSDRGRAWPRRLSAASSRTSPGSARRTTHQTGL